MSRKLIAPFALAVAAVAAAPSYADSLQTGSFVNGFENVTVSLTAPSTLNESGEAGGFFATFGGKTFAAYCVDLFKGLNTNTSYGDYTAVAGSAYGFTNTSANADLGKLFSEGVTLDSSVAQAAFQLAVWEIVYETSGSYSVGTGTAQFGSDAAGVVDLANTWLSALANTTSTVDLTVYQSPTAQDIITSTPAVPEPSTYALLAAGLLTVAFVARRRPSKN